MIAAKGQSKDLDVVGAHGTKYYGNISLVEFHTMACPGSPGIVQPHHKCLDRAECDHRGRGGQVCVGVPSSC